MILTLWMGALCLQQLERPVADKLLVTLETESEVVDFVVSENGHSVAIIYSLNGKRVISMGAWRSEPFDRIYLPHVSHDGKKVVAIGIRDSRFWLFSNRGNAEGPFDGIGPFLATSSDCSKVVYGVRNKGDTFIMANGVREKKPYAWGDPYAISSDGEGLAYVSGDDGTKHVIQMGEVRGPYNDVACLSFTKDERTPIYAATKADGIYLVRGEKEVRLHSKGRVSHLSTARSGSDVAALISDMDKGIRFILVNGKEHPTFGDPKSVLLSADGRTVGYTATSAKNAYVVIGGKKGEDFDEVSPPQLSADGMSFAHWAVKKGKMFVVFNNIPSEAYSADDNLLGAEIRSSGRGPFVSADGKASYFCVRIAGAIWWKVLRN